MIFSSIKKLAEKAGMDGAIAFSVLLRLMQVLGGVLTVYLIALNLSSNEQGYYYTFASIVALQIFFELGINNIITQFVAHENANLEWNGNCIIGGQVEASSRLSSLLRFMTKWFSFLALFLVVVLVIAGFIFFNRFQHQGVIVDWQTPWLLLVISTALSFLFSPFLSFLEGLNKVKQVAQIRFFQYMVNLVVVSIFYLLGFGLYALPMALIISSTVVFVWLFYGSNLVLWKDVWMRLGEWEISYGKEIFPYQWKIALSWISGYFIFQIFNPVLFATEGPKVAGQMGMTLNILNSIYALAYSWISTKIPVMSGLIASGEYTKLDKLFSKSFFQSSVVDVLLLLSFYVVLIGSNVLNIHINGVAFSDRFLNGFPLLFLLFTFFMNHISSSLATYLRCHKQEPLMVQSLVVGVLCGMSTFYMGNAFGVLGITGGYAIIVLGSVLWIYNVFGVKRKEWHRG
jgi:O-antigen/teichoic acid export membrane protein